MANSKISELTAVTAVNIVGTEEIALVQSTETKKTTLEDVQRFVVNHLEPTTLSVVAGGTYDLGDEVYDEAELIVLSWVGDNGTATITLPDVTLAKNLNRAKRLITDSSFNNATHANLTPYGSQTLDGTNDAFDLNREYEGIKVWGNGTEWFIIQQKA